MSSRLPESASEYLTLGFENCAILNNPRAEELSKKITLATRMGG